MAKYVLNDPNNKRYAKMEWGMQQPSIPHKEWQKNKECWTWKKNTFPGGAPHIKYNMGSSENYIHVALYWLSKRYLRLYVYKHIHIYIHTYFSWILCFTVITPKLKGTPKTMPAPTGFCRFQTTESESPRKEQN